MAMSDWISVRLRTWVLGAAVTGLLGQSVTVVAQGKNRPMSNAKKPGAKPVPAQTTTAPKLLAVPNSNEAATNEIQPVSQIAVAATGEKSEVQRQLEKLYEQDGREMPDVNTMTFQPLSTATGKPQAGSSTSPAAGAVTGQPVAQPSQKQARSGQGHTQYQPPVRTQATAYPAAVNSQPAKNYAAAIDAQGTQQSQPPSRSVARQNPVTGFFKKMIPGQKTTASTSQAPIPPDYRNAVTGVPPSTGANVATQPNGNFGPPMQSRTSAVQTIPATRPTTKPAIAATPARNTTKQFTPSVQITTGIASNSLDLPSPTAGMPPLAQVPLALPVAILEVAMPPLMTEPQLPLSQAPSKVEPLARPARVVVADFPNPFPEVTEIDADLKTRIPPRDAAEILEEPETPKETDEPPAVVGVPEALEDPFAVEARDFSEPSIDESIDSSLDTAVSALDVLPEVTTPSILVAPPELTAPPDLVAPPALTAPSVDVPKPAVDSIPGIAATPPDVGGLVPPAEIVDPHVEKMRRIRERFGMKGLKGFCPVTLHDERELMDAKPEFHFTHRSQKFHFASAEARDKFEADPSAYAPAAYGADVVALSRDKDVVEGTLDFAAWFKGRLYLFGSQATYETFVAGPSRYATPLGIE
jgi:YHS domain-containing protein